MKKKIIVLLICLFGFFLLLAVSFCQWNGVDVYEASGVRNGWWIGPFFNEIRELLGNKPSAILTIVFAIFPLYVAAQYWRGKLN